VSLQERQRQKRIKADVIERDGSLCCYCDQVLSIEELTMEHLIPYSKGGSFNATNLTVACAICNQKRGNRPFFEYCKQFNWHNDKVEKYQRLYIANIKIKILNVAKENIQGHVMPLELIKNACQKLNMPEPDFSTYEKNYCLTITLQQESYWSDVKFNFIQLIRIIEAEAK
jgi:HNH endonuclease